MKAIVSTVENDRIVSELTEMKEPSLKAGEVKIKVEYSSINYKDALGVTGVGRIFKKFPIVGGIDAAGVVTMSHSKNFKVGDPVLVTGCGLGETHDGGYEEFVAESENNVVPRTGLTSRQAMTYGTAGFTAALALARMQQNGQTPDKGPILVTGASGGVGQFAIQLFSRAGFEVHALTGKSDLRARLEKLGAKKIFLSDEFPLKSRPLEAVQYGGAVDNLGGETLASIVARVQLWGNVACIGLAESTDLHTTVMPMILRGVSLLGISSNNCPYELRAKLWQKLATQTEGLDEFVSQDVGLDDVLAVSQQMLSRKTHGRVLVKL